MWVIVMDFSSIKDNTAMMQRAGFLPPDFHTFKHIIEAADAAEAADVQLFRSVISNDDHVLHQLLPP